MKAKEFDEHFDNGGDIEQFADLEKATRPNKIKRVKPLKNNILPKR